MRPERRAGYSETWLVMVMGGLTLAALVALMAVGRGSAVPAEPDAEALDALREQVRQVEAERDAAVEARERAEARLLEAPADVEEDDEAWQALTEENALLRQQVRELTEQMAVLTGTPVELEVPRPPVVRAPGVLAPKVLQDVRVVDVNPGIGYAVIDVGEEHGVRPGMSFVVMREGRTVARVKAEDVREVLTGVSVSLADGGIFPMPGDRAIWTATD